MRVNGDTSSSSAGYMYMWESCIYTNKPFIINAKNILEMEEGRLTSVIINEKGGLIVVNNY